MNTGLQNQSVYYQRTSPDAEESKVFLDVNTLSEDGTTSVSNLEFSRDGRLCAYFVSKAGSDWRTISVRDTVTMEDSVVDEIPWCKFGSLAWSPDSKGFFYTRFPAPETSDAGTEVTSLSGQKLFYHQLGQPYSNDEVVFEDTVSSQRIISVESSEDGNWLIMYRHESTSPENLLSVAPLTAGHNLQWAHLMEEFLHEFNYIANDDSTFWWLSNYRADGRCILKHQFGQQSLLDAQEIYRPSGRDVLESVSATGAGVFVTLVMRDVVHRLFMIDPSDGKQRGEVSLPTLGTVTGLSTRYDETEIFMSFSSFTYAGTILAVVLDASSEDGIVACNRREIFRIEVPGLVPEDFRTEQVFVDSKDGTKVPMFLVSWNKSEEGEEGAEGLEAGEKGQAPTLLYGYGGFNISLTPSFSALRLAFVQSFRGIYAVANLRGGGEYGESWHKAGKKEQKQNVFDDFHAAASWLTASGKTIPSRICSMGGSNGGLLVAATSLQRPDLYGAVVGQVGVMDMLKYHTFTIGHFWADEYGSADVSEAEFRTLLAYSPLHSVRSENAAALPPSLFLTADHDDRVVPAHSYKLAATLQEKHAPVALLSVEVNAGHGAGKSLTKVVDEYARIFTFVGKALNAVPRF
jgi:prolyl oligopeptidase